MEGVDRGDDHLGVGAVAVAWLVDDLPVGGPVDDEGDHLAIRVEDLDAGATVAVPAGIADTPRGRAVSVHGVILCFRRATVKG